MRDIALTVFIFSCLPLVFKRPFYGVLLYTWVSLMSPHRLTYGFAYDFPFEALIVVATLISLLANKEEKKFPLTPVTVTLLLLIAWMCLTTFSALEPDRAWAEWNRVMKTMFLTGVALMVIKTKQEVIDLAWVVALSLGFYGFKGGVFMLTGGGGNVFGPEGSYIQDNNALALALVATVPLIWYILLSAQRKIFRYGAIALTALTLVAAIGSNSRGAMLGGVCMLGFLWLKSRHKVRTGFALLLLIPLVYAVAPESWFTRMDTIGNYQQDSSALGRINAWGFAQNVANTHFMGGGFDCFTPRMFTVYAPDPRNHHAAHSIYFQVLGEHGYVGLVLFVLFMFFTWRTGSRIIKHCKGREDLKWALDLAAMCQVSIIGYAVGGAFLTMAWYDLYYDIVALLLLTEKVLGLRRKETIVSANPSSAMSPLEKT